MKWDVILICVILSLFSTGILGELLDNPYKILGLHRRASQKDVRQAYLQLAKEWHPDKSKAPEAEDRFIEIKQAYELLSDPERRSMYDKKGITEDDYYKRPERPPVFTQSPFDDLFGPNGAHFNFQENDITFFHKLSITRKQYDKTILPKSEKTPYLLFFYTDWCFPCLQCAPFCRKLSDNLEPLGISFVTVHSTREAYLTRRLNVNALPCLVLLIDGNSYVYKDGITNIPKIIEFIKSKFPYKLVTKVQEDNLDEFLNGWSDNRVRGLILPHKTSIRLRYLVTAFHFRQRVAFGIADTEKIHNKYQVPLNMDSLLLFNENISHPMASVTMTDIPTNTLHNIINSNQYLALPRLSSQKILDELCPCEWNKPKKKICVALVTDESVIHDVHRQTFRQYAQKFPYGSEKVRFAYIYHKRQSSFLNALRPDGEYIEPLLRIVLFWRRDTSRVRYEWAPVKWEIASHLNNTHEKLGETILRLLKSTENFPYEAYVTDLFDEHALSFIGKTFVRAAYFLEALYDDLDKEQILPAFSVIGTLIFILAIGYFMSYLVEKEEEHIRKKKAERESGNNNNISTTSYQPELKLHELRSEKYNGLVRLLKPGCRTILLILDMQSRQQLIPPFHKAVWPYRKNKALNFAYMYIERGLTWYKELLQLSLFEERELNINPRNCVGTVLSLNGHRKYFCMFHAKHTESKRKQIKAAATKPGSEKDCESGAFIGFNSDESDSESEEVLLQGTLLDGLSTWLDRLFEGTTQRYHVNYWPEFPIK